MGRIVLVGVRCGVVMTRRLPIEMQHVHPTQHGITKQATHTSMHKHRAKAVSRGNTRQRRSLAAHALNMRPFNRRRRVRTVRQVGYDEARRATNDHSAKGSTALGFA